jgi:hypothetical protein
MGKERKGASIVPDASWLPPGLDPVIGSDQGERHRHGRATLLMH